MVNFQDQLMWTRLTRRFKILSTMLASDLKSLPSIPTLVYAAPVYGQHAAGQTCAGGLRLAKMIQEKNPKSFKNSNTLFFTCPKYRINSAWRENKASSPS